MARELGFHLAPSCGSREACILCRATLSETSRSIPSNRRTLNEPVGAQSENTSDEVAPSSGQWRAIRAHWRPPQSFRQTSLSGPSFPGDLGILPRPTPPDNRSPDRREVRKLSSSRGCFCINYGDFQGRRLPKLQSSKSDSSAPNRSDQQLGRAKRHGGVQLQP